jgi:type IV secretion system protein VirB11
MITRAGERTLRLLIAPINTWLDDPHVTEVCINRPGEVWVERHGEWQLHLTPSFDFSTLDCIVTLAAAMTQQDVGPNHPLCATALPDGQRMQICRPPAVGPGLVSITIRRPSSFRPTLNVLEAKGLFGQATEHGRQDVSVTDAYRTSDPCAFLTAAVLARKNILICGATGSGKTTLARALIEEIPRQERLITIEDTPEWDAIPQRNRVALFYSKGDQGSARVRSEDLLEASLRMRPDRVLMQELRDGAAFAYLRGVVAGHPGSITTLHAESAGAAFDALRLMVRQHPAGATLADPDVRELLSQMVDIVVHCERRGTAFSVSELWWKEGDHAA